MSDNSDEDSGQQSDLFQASSDRALLDRLIEESRLYITSKSYSELLNFVVRLRNFAPFNAMLLQVQKPGLTYAMSLREWRVFGRRPKEGARPLLILWPFGPVALVYDIQDTEGQPLPTDIWSFHAQGSITPELMNRCVRKLFPQNIECKWVDTGDGRAGLLRIVHRARTEKEANRYVIQINQNHDPATQLTTLAHELAHLFLGHLGGDKKLKITPRDVPDHSKRELEAESVAFLVCCRNGVVPKSQSYLSEFVNSNTTIRELDVYQILRAAGQVETLLALTVSDLLSRTQT